MSCNHPLEGLRLDPGNAGSRGYTSAYKVTCDACDASMTGELGLAVLVERVLADAVATRDALRRLGAPLQDKTPPRPPLGHKPQCLHPLPWIRVLGAGGGKPGYTGSLSFRCVGCKVGWPLSAGLALVFNALAADRKEVWSRIRALEKAKGVSGV